MGKFKDQLCYKPNICDVFRHKNKMIRRFCLRAVVARVTLSA